MTYTLPDFAEAQMLIRKPVSIVFDAFIDPAITRHFWFTKANGRLEENKRLTWEWEMYEVSTKVTVREVTANKRISIEWDEPSTIVDFDFEPIGDEATYVTIKHHGFKGTRDEIFKGIIDSTSGFTTVLDGLKAYLEHGIELNLIADKFPTEAAHSVS